MEDAKKIASSSDDTGSETLSGKQNAAEQLQPGEKNTNNEAKMLFASSSVAAGARKKLLFFLVSFQRAPISVASLVEQY